MSTFPLCSSECCCGFFSHFFSPYQWGKQPFCVSVLPVLPSLLHCQQTSNHEINRHRATATASHVLPLKPNLTLFTSFFYKTTGPPADLPLRFLLRISCISFCSIIIFFFSGCYTQQRVRDRRCLQTRWRGGGLAYSCCLCCRCCCCCSPSPVRNMLAKKKKQPKEQQ